MWQPLLEHVIAGDFKSVARCMSFVENEAEGYEALLENLPLNDVCKTIGITGAPGAGKSSLTDALIEAFLPDFAKIAVLCIDPSSPFNKGALLGDRIRMSKWFSNQNVFIRSVATRGALGGLSAKTIELTDVLKAAGYNLIIIETVGVGQSEIDIAALADVTIVVLVPESGDEVQTMKAGVMEVGDIFVVNKSDRPGADGFVKNLNLQLSPSLHHKKEYLTIVKTIAIQKEGIDDLREAIKSKLSNLSATDGTKFLAEKAYRLISNKRMKDVDITELEQKLREDQSSNLYRFIKMYY
ncbi:MAG: methylmalonyl Co-A mutase-associated GTPase MeaB [Ginsengibacter sp.]